MKLSWIILCVWERVCLMTMSCSSHPHDHHWTDWLEDTCIDWQCTYSVCLILSLNHYIAHSHFGFRSFSSRLAHFLFDGSVNAISMHQLKWNCVKYENHHAKKIYTKYTYTDWHTHKPNKGRKYSSIDINLLEMEIYFIRCVLKWGRDIRMNEGRQAGSIRKTAITILSCTSECFTAFVRVCSDEVKREMFVCLHRPVFSVFFLLFFFFFIQCAFHILLNILNCLDILFVTKWWYEMNKSGKRNLNDVKYKQNQTIEIITIHTVE